MLPSFYHITIKEADGNTVRLNLKRSQFNMLCELIEKYNDNGGNSEYEYVRYNDGAEIVVVTCQFTEHNQSCRG